MYVKRPKCPECLAPFGTCPHSFLVESKFHMCGQCGASDVGTIDGYLFCWNCVISKRAFEPYWLHRR